MHESAITSRGDSSSAEDIRLTSTIHIFAWLFLFARNFRAHRLYRPTYAINLISARLHQQRPLTPRPYPTLSQLLSRLMVTIHYQMLSRRCRCSPVGWFWTCYAYTKSPLP